MEMQMEHAIEELSIESSKLGRLAQRRRLVGINSLSQPGGG
jgi:hypothetical protein